MSEIKGLDQIFPKKPQEESGKGSFKIWMAAGAIALLAAGYALVAPGSAKETTNPAATMAAPVVAIPQSAVQSAPKPAVSVKQQEQSKKAQIAAITEDRKAAKKAERRSEVVQTAAAPEVKAAVKAMGRACNCETAELSLPAQCPDGACRQCKISCGIPGN